MFEKDMRIAVLLDCYGELLSDHRREMIEMYYFEDLSLSEIAENAGISRQAVRDSIKKSETELHHMEEKLHLAEKFAQLRARCAAEAEAVEAALPHLPEGEIKSALRGTAAYLRAIPI